MNYDVKNIYKKIESLSIKYNLENTLKSLPFALKVHENDFRRGSGLPYITHPLFIVNYLIKLNIINDEAFATAILHDTLEEHPNCGLESLDISERIKKKVSLLTFKQYLLEKKEAQLLYIRKIVLEGEWIENLIKDIDRFHNLTTTKGAFTKEKLMAYSDETKTLFYPMFPIQQMKFKRYCDEFQDLEEKIRYLINDIDNKNFIPIRKVV